MKQINYIDLFNRQKEKKEILDFLSDFSVNKLNMTRGIYLLGKPGCGKTSFIEDIIPKDEYDVVRYDASDTRTKSVIPELLGNKLSNVNVLDLFSKKRKKLIVMDEMDYMNSGDKGGIKELIKFVRAKKTKKQQKEPFVLTPVIFIGTNDNDKKIRELINVCKLVRLENPSNRQVFEYINNIMGSLDENYKHKLVEYCSGNLRKLTFFIDFYNKDINNMKYLFDTLDNKYSHQNYTKNIIKNLYSSYVPISDYATIIKETDRTTLGLLWHENLTSIINTEKHVELYKNILDNLCLGDYIDRIIFQNQIWQLSEQNSFIKIFYSNYYLHNTIKKVNVPDDIIFTKVLTKYSTEYNNYCFFQQLAQKVFLEKDDMLRLFNSKTSKELVEKYYITELDIDRAKRFIKNANFTIV